MVDKAAAPTAPQPPAASQQPAASQPPAGEAKRTRKPVKRLTAEEKRAKITTGVEDNLQRAGELVVFAANGFVNRGDRARARACLEIWDRLISTALPEEPEEPDGQ